MSFAPIAGGNAHASAINRYLTKSDLSRPVLLDQNGMQLQLPSTEHRHPTYPAGSTPTYLAFPLGGKEHLPSGTQVLMAGTQANSSPVGPLELDATLKAGLGAALASTSPGVAVIDTPARDYLVEYLPRYRQTHDVARAANDGALVQTYNGIKSWLAAETSTSAGTSTSTSTSSGTGQSASKAQIAKANSTANQITSFLNSPTSSIASLTSKSVSELDKLLGLSTAKPTATKPSLNLEAQLLVTPQIDPPPIPEPSTWLIFGVMLSATAAQRARLKWAKVRRGSPAAL